MRFRSRQDRIPYFNLRDQKRLLRLVGLLVLVVIAINVASNPSVWKKLFFESPDADSTARTAPRQPSPKELDFRVRLDEESDLAPGEFRSPPTTPPPGGSAGDVDDPDGEPADAVKIDPALLKPIRDNVIGVRSDERPAFFAMLAKARDLPPRTLESVAEKNVSYTVLNLEAQYFRGKVVRLQGELKRLFPFRASQNEFGIDQLYEAWILTADSDNNPYRVVCTSIPEGMPTGEIKETVTVQVTGYFMKREGYESVGGMHVAPLLLARTLRWLKPQRTEPADTSPGLLAPVIMGFSILLAGVLGFTIWRLGVGDRSFHKTHLKRLTAAPAEAIDALQNVETTDLNQLFEELRRRDEETPEES